MSITSNIQAALMRVFSSPETSDEANTALGIVSSEIGIPIDIAYARIDALEIIVADLTNRVIALESGLTGISTLANDAITIANAATGAAGAAGAAAGAAGIAAAAAAAAAAGPPVTPSVTPPATPLPSPIPLAPCRAYNINNLHQRDPSGTRLFVVAEFIDCDTNQMTNRKVFDELSVPVCARSVPEFTTNGIWGSITADPQGNCPA